MNGKHLVKDFDIEDLLFRSEVILPEESVPTYYRDKTVLITGGGGSIGGELSRQIAGMEPKRLILLDIYENGVYDIQQELRMMYGERLNLSVEIVSICDRAGLSAVFDAYHPEVVIHAAAHKHVPLMEHNCCEAVKNNVFGTCNVVELSELYGVGRFLMVS
ncbi:MAG: polysaccharide biosynthesis protein, partial [Clostridia bacterium]|nr:polysaccharide biosynthesis protein [Clostridia bacterium]